MSGLARLRRIELPLAVALVALQLGMIVGGLVLSELGRGRHPFSETTLALDIGGALSVFAFPAVGLVILASRPGNPIGWLFVLANLGWALSNLATAYVEFATVVAPLPAAPLVAWLATWPGPASSTVLLLVVLLFPDGRAPSPRWRWLGKLIIAWGAITAASSAFAPGPVTGPQLDGLIVPNPLGVAGPLGPVLAVVAREFEGASVLFFALVSLSMVLRLRRSTGHEHQQMAWFTYSVVLVAALLLAQTLAAMAYGDGWADAPVWARILNLVAIGSVGQVAVATGVAVLRYRLYEIDRIVSRTVAYAAVSAVLAGTFAATILVLQGVLAPLTGDDTLAVAGSTLLVAALFQPLRRRVQSVADRRFNRSRYDAEREVEAFAARVRDEVEVEPVAAALSQALEQTIQPASAAIWLRVGGRR